MKDSETKRSDEAVGAIFAPVKAMPQEPNLVVCRRIETQSKKLVEFPVVIINPEARALLFQSVQPPQNIERLGRVALSSGYTDRNWMDVAAGGIPLTDEAFEDCRSPTAERIKYNAVELCGGKVFLDERLRKHREVRA